MILYMWQMSLLISWNTCCGKLHNSLLVESRAVCAAIEKLNYQAKTTAAMFTSKQRMDALEGSLTAFVLVREFVYSWTVTEREREGGDKERVSEREREKESKRERKRESERERETSLHLSRIRGKQRKAFMIWGKQVGIWRHLLQNTNHVRWVNTLWSNFIWRFL